MHDTCGTAASTGSFICKITRQGKTRSSVATNLRHKHLSLNYITAYRKMYTTKTMILINLLAEMTIIITNFLSFSLNSLDLWLIWKKYDST